MKMVNKVAVRSFIVLSIFSVLSLPVRAVEFLSFLPPNPTGDSDLITFVNRVISLAIGMAGLIAVVFLVYNGILYIISGGDESKVEKATKGITYAVIGLIICFVSVLVKFVLGNIIQAQI